MIGRCMFYGKGGPLRGCEGSFVHLDFSCTGDKLKGETGHGPVSGEGGGRRGESR